MNSKILETIGLQNIDPAIYLITLIVILIGTITYCVMLNKKYKVLIGKYDQFMSGKDAESLEEAFSKRFKDVDNLISENEKKTKQLELIEKNLHITFEKVGIVKYDAFNEMGGKLSFALVLLNKDNTGFVMNSMHGREGCYTYIKEIINGESYVALGEEEKEALQKALEKTE